jgi:hypothetical protein
MAATILQFRPRQHATPSRWALLDAIFEEEAARRDLIQETAATLAKAGYSAAYARTLGAAQGWEPSTTLALASAMAVAARHLHAVPDLEPEPEIEAGL